MGQVAGKFAIRTGGACGIGAAVPRNTRCDGATEMITDQKMRAASAADLIVNAGGEAIFLHRDLSRPESWPGIIDHTERRFGRVDGYRRPGSSPTVSGTLPGH